MSFKKLFSVQLPKAFAQMVEEGNAPDEAVTFVFNLLESTEETWTVRLEGSEIVIEEGECSDFDCRVTMKKGALDKLLRDELNILKAVLPFGQIKLKGSTRKLLLFKDILDYL